MKKLLLMGRSGSGKTSLRSIIFANYTARDTRMLKPTHEVEKSHIKFLGNLVLNIWDCGGQEEFIKNYFTSRKDDVFRNVEVLIYVFDVECTDLDKDMHYYQSCLEAILQNSPKAKIFCLIHKMDLVQKDKYEVVLRESIEDLKKLSKPLRCTCFGTSIWDETLYEAWSKILQKIIPNIQEWEKSLSKFANLIGSDKVLLFEKRTLLVISHCEIKQRKDFLSQLVAQVHSMIIKNVNFICLIEGFTPSTYVMVITSDPEISSAVTLMNITSAREHFEKLEGVPEIQSALTKSIGTLTMAEKTPNMNDLTDQTKKKTIASRHESTSFVTESTSNCQLLETVNSEKDQNFNPSEDYSINSDSSSIEDFLKELISECSLEILDYELLCNVIDEGENSTTPKNKLNVCQGLTETNECLSFKNCSFCQAEENVSQLYCTCEANERKEFHGGEKNQFKNFRKRTFSI